MSDSLKIGDTLYHFSESRRVYPNKNAGPSYEGHFQARKITGETKLSWLMEPHWSPDKVSKKEIVSGYSRGYYTEAGKSDAIWKHDHRINIEYRIRGATADQLRQIAAIIGYEL